MSMYNMVVGHDPAAGAVLTTLGYGSMDELQDIPRFRDAYIDVGGDTPKLVILTRTGGNNRSDYEKENEALRQRPGFIDDIDDSLDPTFAHWRYAVPDEAVDRVNAVIESGREAGWTFPTPMERLKAAVEGMKQGGEA